jgi:hypothetical protein
LEKESRRDGSDIWEPLTWSLYHPPSSPVTEVSEYTNHMGPLREIKWDQLGKYLVQKVAQA